MTATTARAQTDRPWWIRHWPVLLAAVALGAPTLKTLAQQVWSTTVGAHGPIIFATGAWLIWRQIPVLRRDAVPGSPWLTAAMLALALPIYVVGRAYDFLVLETAGLYGFLLAVLQAHVGLRAMLNSWFPLLYLGFLIPPPNWLMDGLTAPLKEFVSFAATSLLQAVGIPIVREGVTLIVAQYQLLVEDACSGMNSLTGLIGVSLFYIYLQRNASWRYSLLLVALVVPIAVIANIIRVMTLVLLTYFFGDAVGQSFLHMAAGLFLFVTALFIIFGLDSLLVRFWLQRRPTGGQPA